LFNKIGLRTEHDLTVDVSGFPSGSLAGYNIYYSVRRTLTSSAAVISLNSVDNSSQVQVTDPSGSIKLILEASDTANLYSGAYYWQIDAIPITGVNTIAYPSIGYGDIILQKNVYGLSSGSTPVTSLDLFVTADTTGGDFDYTLPAASSWAGRNFVIKADALSGGVVNIYPYSGETIDGDSSFIINTPYGSVTLYSNGTNIYVTAII